MGTKDDKEREDSGVNEMDIKKLTECIGLSAEELKPFLISEIDEFLASTDPKDQIDEFHDILFALKNIAYAHTGNHFDIDHSLYETKIENRIKQYGTISKKEPIFSHACISRIPIGVVHISFGNFKQPWSHFDPFKNGTEVEIAMLTDNEFGQDKKYTNHIIINFDAVDNLTYSFLTSSWNEYEKNTILCKIPDFIYKKAKENVNFKSVENLLSLQFFSALKNLNLTKDCIFHFHSWESALALDSKEVKDIIKGHVKIFSPYLTVSRLKDFLKKDGKSEGTLDKEELIVASKYEESLVKYCDMTIVESERDKLYYEKIGGKKIKKYSYLDPKEHVVPANGIIDRKLNFVAGGRPVYEKGFVELVKELPGIIEYANKNGLKFNLKIFCKEYDRLTRELKKSNYIKELEDTISKLNLGKYVSVLDKVSINKLREEIKGSCGLIVPSLYDPYCLMPHYSIDENKVSFVSKYTGISENIKSRDYIFDPLKKGSLLNSIKKWMTDKKDFILNNTNTNYKTLYKR
ncbi:MAG: hypothetical protein ACP5NZ_02095 [Nanobdellota archaeon]